MKVHKYKTNINVFVLFHSKNSEKKSTRKINIFLKK